VTKFLTRLCIASVALVALSAVPSFAYPESTTNVEPSGPPPMCSDCHSLESRTQETSKVAQVSKPSTWSAFDPEAGTFVGSRKGPHGGYTAGTQKCATCHMVHNASGGSDLLPDATIAATCNTCHDGTGGGGVYGVIQYRTGVAPLASHKIGDDSLNSTGTVTVPGGLASGASLNTTFTGENGSLTCTDCHSPHNSETVNAFIGDRKRSSADTSTRVVTNRLLRKMPTKATVGVSEYGSDWCASCHKGAHNAPNASFVHSGAVNSDGYYYRKVIRRAGYDTTAASAVATDLGGSNLGYVMTTETVRPKPICQQCHEDGRHVGDDVAQPFTVDSLTESFTVNTDGVGGGNPRFQNFPHETQGLNLLIEQPDDLCLNCHRF
jgi:Zn-finger protein